MPPSEQAAGRAIISSRIQPSRNPRSPAHSAPQKLPSHYYTNTNYYSQPSASNGHSNQHKEYPDSIPDIDRYTLDDREGDNCTLHSKQSFETMPNDENCVSFFSSPTPTSMNPLTDGRDDSDTEPGLFSPEAEINPSPNFGPRMRFVSPPPWEKSRDEDDDDDNNNDNVSLSDGFSVFSGRFAGRRYREPEKVSIRSLALASMRTPSPTPTTSSRSPYGKAILNASQSQVSLSIKDAPWVSRSTSESPPSGRPSFSQSIRDRGAPPNETTDHSAKQKGRSLHSPLSQDDATVSGRSDSPTSVGPYTHHPYANPDVLPQSGQPNVISGAPPVSYHHHQQQQRQSNESDPGFVRRASESATVATTRSPPTFRKASAGNLPVSQPKLSLKPLHVKHDGNENEIPLLAPVPRNVEAGLPSPKTPYSSHSPVPFPDSPMNNLLSLEEAQRVKKASPESPTMSRFRNGSTLVAGFGLPSGVTPDFEVKRNQTLSPSDSSSTIRENKTLNARQRTISSSKLSNVNSSPSSEDVGGSTKTIKHKKSGFMKLFGKDKDTVKEPPSPNSKTAAYSFNEPIPPVPKRAPPPSLSVVVTSPSVSLPEVETRNHIQQPKTSPPTHEAFPATMHTPVDSVEDDKIENLQSAESHPILSAPPSQSTFEGLSLRPMSMVFSAKFSELFGSLDGSETLSPPVMPAASKSSSGGGSPTTSDFSSRSNSSDYPLTPSSTALSGLAVNIVGRQEENSIASLQAQLMNTQKNHQREIWELESQIRDLKRENEELRSAGTCESCGKLKSDGRLLLKSGGGGGVGASAAAAQTSVVDRPRPKVSRDARSVFGGS